jgi:hypothetical protein
LLVAFVPQLRPVREAALERIEGIYDGARGRVLPDLTPVTPVEAIALSEVPEHPASHAIDGFTNTWWQPADGNGIGAVITVRFEEPIDLREVIVTGAPAGETDETAFGTTPRPRVLRYRINEEQEEESVLEDVPDPQRTGISADGVTQIAVLIFDVYGAEAPGAAPITELEFFAAR